MVKFFVTQTTTKSVEMSIECDHCHKIYYRATEEIKDGLTYITNMKDEWEMGEFHHIDFIGGFDSIFGDGAHVECDLCQHCLKEMIGHCCRITPKY